MSTPRKLFYLVFAAFLTASTGVGTAADGETDKDPHYCQADRDCVAVYAGCSIEAINSRHLDEYRPALACTGSTTSHPNPQDGCSGNSCLVNVPSHCVAHQCAIFNTRDIVRSRTLRTDFYAATTPIHVQ